MPDGSILRKRPAERLGRAGTRPATLIAAGLLASGCASVSSQSDYDRDVSFTGMQTFSWIEPAPDTSGTLPPVDPFLRRRLQRSVEEQLLNRGLVKDTGGEAVDLLVTAYAIDPAGSYAIRESSQGRGPTVSFGVGFGFGYPYGLGYPYAFGYPYRSGYWGCCRYRPPYAGFPYWGFPYWGFPYWGFPFGGYPFGYWSPWIGIAWGASQPVYEAPEGHPPGTLVVDILDARTRELIWRGWSDGALLFAPEPKDLPEFIDRTIAKIMASFPPEA